MKIIITTAVIILICFVIGCSKGSGESRVTPPPPPPSPPQTSCEGVNASFAADIMPIIQTKCAIGSNCHSDGSFSGPGALTSFTKIKNAASQIKSAVNSGRMPLTGSLSATQLQQINCWVDGGTANN